MPAAPSLSSVDTLTCRHLSRHKQARHQSVNNTLSERHDVQHPCPRRTKTCLLLEYLPVLRVHQWPHSTVPCRIVSLWSSVLCHRPWLLQWRISSPQPRQAQQQHSRVQASLPPLTIITTTTTVDPLPRLVRRPPSRVPFYRSTITIITSTSSSSSSKSLQVVHR